MIRLDLTPEEISQLETLRRRRRSPVAERCHYVLLNAQGFSVPRIAQRLKRDEHTIRKWLKAYRDQGLAGLHNAGRPATKGEKLNQQLDTLLSHVPSVYGYIEAGWTMALLRDYLRQQGFHVSDATVRRHLTSGVWVDKRFAKVIPSTAPTAEQKKSRVAEIVATLEPLGHQRPLEVFFVDESPFTNEPYIQRGWLRKGEQVKVPGPAKRQSSTLFGALHLSTQKFYWKRAPQGTSKYFIAFLHQLHQRFPDTLLVLILDHATIHKSRAVTRFVNHHDWITLEHLAPYSSAYNPIERFWQWLKAKVYGAMAFDTMDEVIRQVRQMVWHYNERWLLASTIHFEFEPYQHML